MKAGMTTRMSKAIRAGVLYFLIVFAFGFVLGSIRTLYVAPRLGDFAAIALELPVMLAFAWIACRRLIAMVGVANGVLPRAVMSVTALILLLLAEQSLAVLLLGRTPAEYLASYRDPAMLLGLCGQLLFAAFPVIQRPSPADSDV